jgi:hypothetical protein
LSTIRLIQNHERGTHINEMGDPSVGVVPGADPGHPSTNVIFQTVVPGADPGHPSTNVIFQTVVPGTTGFGATLTDIVFITLPQLVY